MQVNTNNKVSLRNEVNVFEAVIHAVSHVVGGRVYAALSSSNA
jgi:hypothetical protein